MGGNTPKTRALNSVRDIGNARLSPSPSPVSFSQQGSFFSRTGTSVLSTARAGMQRQSQHPLRPVPVQGASELQQLLEAARAGNLQNRSAFSTVATNSGIIPEFNLYSQFQLSQLLGNNSSLQIDQLAQLQQLQQPHQQMGAAALLNAQQALPESSMTSRSSQGRGNSRGDKSSSAYASRHQAAEQRRRTRINDRLEQLRQIVPHSERANTAAFLEETLKYIQMLQARITELETAQGLPLTCLPAQKQGAVIPASWSQPAANGGPPAMQTAFSPAAITAATMASGHAQPASLGSGAPQKVRPETPPQNSGQAGSEGTQSGNAGGVAPENEATGGSGLKRQKLSPSNTAS